LLWSSETSDNEDDPQRTAKANNSAAHNHNHNSFFLTSPDASSVGDESTISTMSSTPEDESLIDKSHFLINPSMLFLDDGHGGYEWVRSVRLHSMEASVNSQTSYQRSPLVEERVCMYQSHILLGSEAFQGDLSGDGFDFESVSKWDARHLPRRGSNRFRRIQQ
jgi:hypothetical protein